MAGSSSNSLFEVRRECVREIDSYNERVHFGPLRESLGLPSPDLERSQPSPVRGWKKLKGERERDILGTILKEHALKDVEQLIRQ